MADSIFDAVMAELTALEIELEKDVRFQKLTHLRALRDLYMLDDPNDLAKPANKGEQNKAMVEARQFIASQDGPVPTTDVLDYLRGQGFRIGGTDPRNNLSAMLSNTGWFEANGRKGWTIKEPSPPPRVSLAPPPPRTVERVRSGEVRLATTPVAGLDDDIPF